MFRIDRSKDRLPEAGAMFSGGASKRNIGFLGNAPFIAVQRYIRPRLERLLRRYCA